MAGEPNVAQASVELCRTGDNRNSNGTNMTSSPPIDGTVKAVQHAQIDVNGTKLAYRDAGPGEPVVLVHANISDMRSWDPVEDKLAETFRVIVYSGRYHWPNQPIADLVDDPWVVHAKDLAELIENLQLPGCMWLATQAARVLYYLSFFPSMPPTLGQAFNFLISQPWSFLPTMTAGVTVFGPATTAFKKGDHERTLANFGRGVLGEAFFAKLSKAGIEQMQNNLKPHKALFLDAGVATVPGSRR